MLCLAEEIHFLRYCRALCLIPNDRVGCKFQLLTRRVVPTLVAGDECLSVHKNAKDYYARGTLANQWTLVVVQ